MHKAVLSHVRSGYDGLHYVFYPYDMNFHRDHMPAGMTPMEIITKTYNKSGYHVHAWAGCRGGFDVWVERMTFSNRWGDTETNYDYRQVDKPKFEGDVREQ